MNVTCHNLVKCLSSKDEVLKLLHTFRTDMVSNFIKPDWHLFSLKNSKGREELKRERTL